MESNIESVFIINSLQTTSESVEKEVEGKLLREFIESSLQKLKPEYRLLIDMKYRKQMSYQEIAEELQVPMEIVQQRLHRARVALQKKLKDWMIDNE